MRETLNTVEVTVLYEILAFIRGMFLYTFPSLYQEERMTLNHQKHSPLGKTPYLNLPSNLPLLTVLFPLTAPPLPPPHPAPNIFLPTLAGDGIHWPISGSFTQFPRISHAYKRYTGYQTSVRFPTLAAFQKFDMWHFSGYDCIHLGIFEFWFSFWPRGLPFFFFSGSVCLQVTLLIISGFVASWPEYLFI